MAVLLGLVIGELVEIGTEIASAAVADLVAEAAGDVISAEGQTVLSEAAKITTTNDIKAGAKYTKRKISEAVESVGDKKDAANLKTVKDTSEPVFKKMRECVTQ
ncbi:hypothetical protein ElyMa_001930400 [Elysia marginata]|uniref:Senescence domain-containing protein n=1 Tax=Elysia marginata TaxID=1093978 RepID=A0AAV4EVN3_9GAST|nr:hypothetical protein ElyMa_001930400 [Elysia marginata]